MIRQSFPFRSVESRCVQIPRITLNSHDVTSEAQFTGATAERRRYQPEVLLSLLYYCLCCNVIILLTIKFVKKNNNNYYCPTPQCMSHNVNSKQFMFVQFMDKMVHFVPHPKLPSAKEMAEVLLYHVCHLHGFPKDVVSDCGPQFVSQFWKAFCTVIGATVSLFSGFHPQWSMHTTHFPVSLRVSLLSSVHTGTSLHCSQSLRWRWGYLLPRRSFAVAGKSGVGSIKY